MAEIVKPVGATKKKTIVGRGSSSKGRTCGRGNNGQNSRSGGGVRPGFEGGQMPLYRRVARRGFSNGRFKEEVEIVNLSSLEKVFSDGETVSYSSLREKGLLSTTKDVKILSMGDITKKLVIDGVRLSSQAKEKIVKAGGEIKG